MKSESSISFQYDRAVFLESSGLWLDPPVGKPFAFISHAHSDHFAPHERILCSEVTHQLILARYGKRKSSFLPLEFGECHEESGYRFTLLPAGHIAGSAQILVEDLATGHSLLYTGDFKIRSSLIAEPIEIRKADVLIMETTFGLPRYQFPPSDQILDRIAAFVEDTLDENRVPVVQGYSLGKAQELIAALHQRLPQVPFQVHPSVQEMNLTLAGLGFSLPDCAVLDPDKRNPHGHVIVIPPSVGRSKMMRSLREIRTCFATGWAVNPGARFRFQVDEVFPLSDHAGYDELLAFVAAVDPLLTYTLHGSAADFAADLRSRGREAWSLLGQNQLELNLGLSPKSSFPQTEDGSDFASSGELAELAALCLKIRDTAGRKRKRDLLASYLGTLPKDTLEWVCLYLSGRCFPASGPLGVKRSTGTGWALIRRALVRAARITEAEFLEISTVHLDPASIASRVLEGKNEAQPSSILDTKEFFESLAELAGPLEKESLLIEWFQLLHHSESALLVGILLGDLRIGLGDSLIEEAIAEAFEAPPPEVRKAQMYTGHLGLTAILASERRLDQWELTPFNPLSCMLANSAESAEEIHHRLSAAGTEPIWLEDKYHGIRAQLHKFEDSAAWFSRDLRSLDGDFPELIDAALELDRDVVLDGEIIAFAEGRRLSFADLQTRLASRRNEGDLFLGDAVPVRFIVFDLLWLNGRVLTETPLRARREQLEKLRLPDCFTLAEVRHATSPVAIGEQYERARKSGNEGLVAKDPHSHYLPGMRGKAWLKLKKPTATLDLTIVQARLGQGRRAGLLSEFSVAAREQDTGALKIIGTVSSGLSDEEIEVLSEQLLNHSISVANGVHEIAPGIVLEVAFDSIQSAHRHESGLSLRSPKIIAVRGDKTLESIDTLETVRQQAGLV